LLNRANGDHLFAILENVVDGIVTIDSSGIILSFNAAAAHIFGYDAAAVIGQSINSLMAEPYRSEHDHYIKKYLSTGQAKIIGIGREVEGLRRDGTSFPIDLAVSEVSIGNTRVFTGIIRDITERKEYEKEIHRANMRLEEQAEALEEQKREIEQKNKLIAKKAGKLKLASKYKSELLANISHELRTPLNSVLILAKILSENAEGNLTEKQVEFAHAIHHSGSDLSHLINEILDLSKVEAGKMEIHLEEADLNLITASLKENFQPVARKKNLYLNIELAEGVPSRIRTDSRRLEQILKNFLSNAFKFTEQGGVTLNFRLADPEVEFSRPGLRSREAIAISVSDTGKGIPADKFNRIFEAYIQENENTCSEYGGTGLGLSISKGLANLLGGEIHLQSAVGKGATFTLFLPGTLSKTTPGNGDSREPKGNKIFEEIQND